MNEIETNSWEQQIVSIKSDSVIEAKARFGHTSAIYKNSLYIFGGWDGGETLNDIQVYDIERNQWRVLSNIKGSIKGRYRHTSAFNDYAMYIFGGIDQQQERFNDIYEFVFETNSWSRVITIGNAPSKRTFHQSAMYQDSYFFVVGGFDGEKRNDIYRIQLYTPSL